MPEAQPVEEAAEAARARALRAYHVLDTPVETDFDDIAALAAQLCRTPIALVTLVDTDRQWFKARVGLDVCETPRSSSFCAHAMRGTGIMQVPDARRDARFAGNPLVLGEPHVRFYAGAPLLSASGHPLGSVCVIDRVPRLLTHDQCRGLQTLARQVMAQLEIRRYARDVDAANRRLHAADRLKDDFISRVTHELRTPLTSIQGYAEVLAEPGLPAATSDRYVERIRRNSDRLLTLVDDMLLAAQLHTGGIPLNRDSVDLAALAHDAVALNGPSAAGKGLTMTADATGPVVAHADGPLIAQVLDRLVGNAIKFTDSGHITVGASGHGGWATVQVRDTGVGLARDESDRLFAPFRRAGTAERREAPGTGLGLSIVKAIVDGHGGTAAIHGVPGRGTTVTIKLPVAA